MSEIRVNTIDIKDNTSLSIQQNNTTALTIDTSQNISISNDLTVDTNTLYVDSTNNRVGIGTSSPTESLYVQGSGVTRGEFKSTGSGSASSVGAINDAGSLGRILMFGSAQGAYGSLGSGEMALYSNTAGMSIMNDNASGVIKFSMQSGAEKMRIDSSGNVLLGTTSASGASAPDNSSSTGDVGVRFVSSDGFIGIGSDTVALFANRIGSDGEVIRINKDGTQVGSISSNSGVAINIDSGGDRAGLALTGGNVQPRKNSSQSDNTITLGSSSYRFADLYLGGNIYLGGTGSANALDDYEEGTFTVTNAGDATGAFSAETGEYTKIGNMVFIRICFDVSTNFTSFGRIGGLPFTTNGDGAVSSFYPANVMTDNSVNNQILPNFHIGQTYMSLKEDDTNQNQHFPNTTNNIYRICGFYFTDS